MSQETLRSQLYGRNILLGVTGGIACYKACELVRRLKEFGADVRVVMTRGSLAFITPLSFQAVSGNPVHTELLDEKAEAGMGHIELAKWADRVLIAPASANFIERLARGSADDLLSTICLATRAPVQVAPAMNQAMWSNPACQNNIQTLKNNGVAIFGPGSGEQACGDIGAGRML
jgi:phosphopantothenoylcysteine decarboxylase / phosphopantothenate---cysteine ligase